MEAIFAREVMTLRAARGVPLWEVHGPCGCIRGLYWPVLVALLAVLPVLVLVVLVVLGAQAALALAV